MTDKAQTEALDAIKGEPGKLDFKLNVNANKEGFSIKGMLDGSEFSIDGHVTSDKINMTTEMRNVPESDGAVIKVGGEMGNTNNIVGTKQAGNGSEGSGKQKSSLDYFFEPPKNKTHIRDSENNKNVETRRKD